MDQHQCELRRAAARAFAESLDQLQETLQSTHSQPDEAAVKSNNAKSSHAKSSQSHSDSATQFDLDSFEQAVADIEQFMTRKEEGTGD